MEDLQVQPGDETKTKEQSPRTDLNSMTLRAASSPVGCCVSNPSFSFFLFLAAAPGEIVFFLRIAYMPQYGLVWLAFEGLAHTKNRPKRQNQLLAHQ